MKMLILDEFTNDKSIELSEFDLVERVFIKGRGRFNRIQIVSHIRFMGGPGSTKFWLDWSGDFGKDGSNEPSKGMFYSITDEGIEKRKDVTLMVEEDRILHPPCFITYSHSSVEHKEWVRNLATALRGQGVDVVLDQWDLKYGDDLFHFMETNIRESDYVIIVCEPEYCAKANAGTGGVGYEKGILTAEIYKKEKPGKFIPIVRSGGSSSVPTFITNRFYVDFSNDEKVLENIEEVINHIFGFAKHPKPVLGKSPLDV